MLGQTMPQLVIGNAASTKLEMVPVDAAHRTQLPASLDGVFGKLPQGSFLLKNHTAQAITAVVTTWDYIDSKGVPKQLRLNCDAYLLAPLDPIVKANDATLINPYECTGQALFSQMESGSLLRGIQPLAPGSTTLSTDKTIHVYLDSVIFENGDIWGPDNLHYSRLIQERHSAVEQFAGELTASKSGGEETQSALARIRADAERQSDASSRRRAYYARLLQLSPNPDVTLQQLRTQTPLPEFRHIGEL
jgi:hypothetical protein